MLPGISAQWPMTCAAWPSSRTRPSRARGLGRGADGGTRHQRRPARPRLSMVTRLDDCPLPDAYVDPEPYLVTADGIIWSGRRRWVRPCRVAWLFPVGVYDDPDETNWSSWPGATVPGGCPG